MSAPAKAKTNEEATPAAADDVGAQDEIEQIMQEIEGLQQELNSKAAPSGADVPAKAAGVVSESETELTATEEEDILKEFQAAGGDAGMEETLGDLDEETPPTGKSILDAPVDVSAETAEFEENKETELEDEFDELIKEQKRLDQDELKDDSTEDLPMPPQSKSPRSTTAGEAQDGSLTLTLTGNMTLRLIYEFEGQEVVIGFADQSLKVELSDGTEFKVPVQRVKMRKAA